MLYKLTDADACTRGGTLWTAGEATEVEWGGNLCEKGCLHAYRSPLVAAFIDPVHGQYLPDGRLWEAEGEVKIDDGTKIGTDRLVVVREIDVPQLSHEIRVRAAVYCAREVLPRGEIPEWDSWANLWLAGERDEAEAAWAAAETGKSFDLDGIIRRALEEEIS